VLGAVQQKDCPGKKGKMFTETYIEMVTKAKEIQDLCKYKKGDWFIGTFAFYHSEKPKPKVFCKSGLGSFDPREHSWLPTLEDLFGMFDKRNLGETLYFLGDEVNDVNDLYEKTLDWVMLVNYNKSWNGKEWEEIK
jgi:hypothetical protein